MTAFTAGAALAFFLACVEVQSFPLPAAPKPYKTLEVGMFSGIFPDGNAACTGTDGASGTGCSPTGTGSLSGTTAPPGIFVSVPYVTITVTVTPTATAQACSPPAIADPVSTPGAKVGAGDDSPVTTQAGIFGPTTGISEPLSTPAEILGPTTVVPEPTSSPAGIVGTGSSPDTPLSTAIGVSTPSTTADGVFWTGAGAATTGSFGTGTGLGGDVTSPTPTPSADGARGPQEIESGSFASTTMFAPLNPTQDIVPSPIQTSAPLGTDPATPSTGNGLPPVPSDSAPFGNSTNPGDVPPNGSSPSGGFPSGGSGLPTLMPTSTSSTGKSITAAVMQPITTLMLDEPAETLVVDPAPRPLVIDEPVPQPTLQISPQARSRFRFSR